MPIKWGFNQKGNMNENELEKQILRINALEVHIKRLLAFEIQFRASMYRIGKVEEEKHNRKKEIISKYQKEGDTKENVEISQEFHKRDKKLDEITRKLNRLEQMIPSIIPSKHIGPSHTLSTEEAMVREERLQNLVEQLVSKNLAHRIKEQEEMRERIRTLEFQISKLIERENNSPNFYSNEGKKKQQKDRGEADKPCEEEEIQSFHSSIHMRVLALEQNFLLVNEVQAGLLKQVNDLIEKCTQSVQNKGEPEDLALEQEPIFKTLYIDKLYLDKYEQNNNFAQLGIKELSGALNIGATYGRDVIPKEVTEQVKEDIAKMKAVKEEMQEQQMNTDQSEDTQYDESSSDLSTNPPEEDIPYTEITIEEDSSLGEEPYNG